MIKQRVINALASLIPLSVLVRWLPRKFVLYGHLIGDQGLWLARHYRYPTLGEFDGLVEWLRSLGYEFVGLEEYRKEDNKKKVLLTFDDGFKSIYNDLHPYMLRRKIPYMLFILTDPLKAPDFYIKSVAPDPGEVTPGEMFLSIDQIRELKNQEVHIGFHTRGHQLITSQDRPEERAVQTLLTIPEEYTELFSMPLCFAYPYLAPENFGVFNDFMEKASHFQFFFDTKGFAANQKNHFFRVSIDSEKELKRAHWMRYVIKRQLIVLLWKKVKGVKR